MYSCNYMYLQLIVTCKGETIFQLGRLTCAVVAVIQ